MQIGIVQDRIDDRICESVCQAAEEITESSGGVLGTADDGGLARGRIVTYRCVDLSKFLPDSILQDLVRDRFAGEIHVPVGRMVREDLCGVFHAVGMVWCLHQACDLHIDGIRCVLQRHGIADFAVIGSGEFFVDPDAFGALPIEGFAVKHIHPADIVALDKVHFQSHAIPALQCPLKRQTAVRGGHIFICEDLVQVFLRESFAGQPHVGQVVFAVDLLRAHPHAVHVGVDTAECHDGQHHHDEDDEELRQVQA